MNKFQVYKWSGILFDFSKTRIVCAHYEIFCVCNDIEKAEKKNFKIFIAFKYFVFIVVEKDKIFKIIEKSVSNVAEKKFDVWQCLRDDITLLNNFETTFYIWIEN